MTEVGFLPNIPATGRSLWFRIHNLTQYPHDLPWPSMLSISEGSHTVFLYFDDLVQAKQWADKRGWTRSEDEWGWELDRTASDDGWRWVMITPQRGKEDHETVDSW